MNVNFEIAALFPSPFSLGKKGGNFKTSSHLNSVESFLYCLSSNKLLILHLPRNIKTRSDFSVSKSIIKAKKVLISSL